jgi:3-oxoisoapionate decarboxylase
MIKIGLGTYALAWSIGVPGFMPGNPLSIIDFLNKAHSLDADCVQIADNLPMDELSSEELQMASKKASDLGLNVELGIRGLTMERVLQYLDLCQLFDAKLLRVVIDAPDYEPEIGEVIHLLKELLPSLAGAGVQLGIENHDRFSAKEFLQIIQITDSQWIGICMDSVNSLGCGEGFFEVADQLLPYTLSLHLKDYMIKRKVHNMGFDVWGTVAGKGMLPIPWLLEQVKAIGKCQSAILELWPPPEASIKETVEKEQRWVDESMKYLKSLVTAN